MRVTVTISCILLLLTSQVGYYFVYTIRQFQIREQVEQQLLATVPESALEIVIEEENKDAIIWQEEGKEFMLHGQLYDVAKIRKVNGKTLLFCLNDKKEEQLQEYFAKTINSAGDNEKGKNNKHSFKFQVIDKFIADCVELPLFVHPIVYTYFNFKTALVSNCREIIIPPPWKFFS